ncbi:MAG: valine--tRNA ligase [Patescibacteria group bacterium]
MNDKFLKPYNPGTTEDRIYETWEKSGFFNPDNLPRDQKNIDGSSRFVEPFSIVLPPPNVTGVLHMGSAMMLAIQDIMVRYARMTGKKALWIPGTDHAAIATQSVVEKQIKKEEDKSRHDLGREELLKRIDIFAKKSHDTIVTQVRKMGASIDWSREAFTLDEKRSLAVRTAFRKMYEDGLIYRGHRVVNWDPKGQTTISDDEIVYEARKAKLYTFKYSKDIPITISTTRPETKLGDTAIAVHPSDTRYEKYIGKEFSTTFAGEQITLKVIADEHVDPEFGTGALGVTPAHSIIDWEMAQRHELPLKQVINEYGKMTVGSLTIKDKKTTEAREAVVEWLKVEGLLEKEEEIDQNVATAERTGGIVEPLPKLQWFIAVNKKFKRNGEEVTLKNLMVSAVKSSENTNGEIAVVPERFERVYLNWIDNLRDWCISRQIWYGHRIPVWYKTDEIFVGVEAPQGSGWTQDEDTLDTWFSSGLWTFSTLGWPDGTEFAKHREFHPTTILETGQDILFFWVARMILMSTYILGEVPFKTVYLHGLVRDAKGQKISKSLGNNVEPLEMIAKYGADAVRMSLVVAVGPGNDSKVGDDKIKAYKLFSNKIWNATRFVLSSIEGADLSSKPILGEVDQARIKELDEAITDITSDMNNYRYYLAAEKLYHYFWHTFADKIIEESKGAVNGTDADARVSAQWTLLHILTTSIKALHPFMPYITEEIWAELPNSENNEKRLLMIEKWPA